MAASSELNLPRPGDPRRFPIYILIDISDDMSGPPLEAVRRDIEESMEFLEKDITAQEMVRVGIITFGGRGAEFITNGLSPILFSPPLAASGNTPLGQALSLLNESLDKDVRKGIQGKGKGDLTPLVFVFTGSAPTDEWREPWEGLLDRRRKKLCRVMIVGCGPKANMQCFYGIPASSMFDIPSMTCRPSLRIWISAGLLAESLDGPPLPPVPKPPDDLKPVF